MAVARPTSRPVALLTVWAARSWKFMEMAVPRTQVGEFLRRRTCEVELSLSRPLRPNARSPLARHAHPALPRTPGNVPSPLRPCARAPAGCAPLQPAECGLIPPPVPRAAGTGAGFGQGDRMWPVRRLAGRSRPRRGPHARPGHFPECFQKWQARAAAGGPRGALSAAGAHRAPGSARGAPACLPRGAGRAGDNWPALTSAIAGARASRRGAADPGGAAGRCSRTVAFPILRAGSPRATSLASSTLGNYRLHGAGR